VIQGTPNSPTTGGRNSMRRVRVAIPTPKNVKRNFSSTKRTMVNGNKKGNETV
jgi:hypothetical protein